VPSSWLRLRFERPQLVDPSQLDARLGRPIRRGPADHVPGRGVAVAQLLSPVGGLWAVVIGVYLGAIPASAALFASLSEFDLLGLCAAAVRWRRACGQYLPGAGDTTTGYVVRLPSPDRSAEPRVELGRIDQLWALEPETQP